MRLPISLLVVTTFLVGCSTDEDSSITQTILVTSTPNSAAIRLNGDAVGRTPATITVESNSDYQLEVGKGGFEPSVTELKPSLKTDSKGNMFYGFPEKINVTLDRKPGSDDVRVPEADISEFKQLAKQAAAAEGEKVAAAGTEAPKANPAVEIKDDVATVKAKLAERDAAAAAKTEALKKSVAEAKAADTQKIDADKIAALEAQIVAQEKATEAERQSTTELLKALNSRTEELIRLNSDSIKTAKESTNQIEEQKALAAKEAEERTKAEADKQLESVQRIMEEQKALAAKADEQRITAEQQRAAAELDAKKRTYAAFNSRYALLESRRRNKLITEAEFKEQLSELRKELAK